MLVLSSVSVGDPASGQVVRGQLDLHLVAGEDPNVVLPHLTGDGGKDIVTAVDLHSEHGARKRFDDLSLDLDLLLFGYYLPPQPFTRTALLERGFTLDTAQRAWRPANRSW
jgi:hypothetical protein